MIEEAAAPRQTVTFAIFAPTIRWLFATIVNATRINSSTTRVAKITGEKKRGREMGAVSRSRDVVNHDGRWTGLGKRVD